MKVLTTKLNTVAGVVREPKFYEFRQNNSGGSFTYDDISGIAQVVIVEAFTVAEANEKARKIGLYFGGDGDCSCCGNRWYEASAYDASSEPSAHGDPLTATSDMRILFGREDKPYAYVHYLNGKIEGWG